MERFIFRDIDFYSANTIAYFSCKYYIGDFTKPLFTEIGISVMAIEIGYR